MGCGVWGVGCGVWGDGEITCLFPVPCSRLPSPSWEELGVGSLSTAWALVGIAHLIDPGTDQRAFESNAHPTIPRFPIPDSRLACSLLPTPYSLLPTPYSLFPKNIYLTQFKTAINNN
ncbi:hypothetical protein BJP36_41750 [Moorena producens JHB]|uniref:Uncharacterized protein n=1 Tax=Moorena producens (strain JHB) TaxID=1454205 RepID=A0A9Q9SSL9_MOOP1|nr:hypothetical protein [Moorena producens]WAN68891.1 hypothetical protein BJP36_41750 [Moorena producens JHB]